MLLGSTLRQGLEPVRIVSDTVLRCPLFHTGSHRIGNLTVETCAIVHHINHFLIHSLGKILVHLLTVENLLSKILRGSLYWIFYVEWLLLECLTDNLKS